MHRIRSFDWLRGLAVVVMIQTHARSLLLPELRSSETYRQLDRIDGLVAPAFLLTAGFALALTHFRGALWQHSLKRIAKVLAVATLVNCLWFNVVSEPLKLLRLDILHCIGLSLLATLGALTLSRMKPFVAGMVLASLALAAFFAAPLLENAPAPFDLLVAEKSGALFPLFPWSGYVFLGACGGVVAATRPERLQAFMVGMVLFGFGLYATRVPLQSLYGSHMVWRTNPFMAGERLVLVFCGLLFFERFSASFASSRILQFFERFGSRSLSAYFFHEMLLFHRKLGPLCFENSFYQQADWTLYFALVTAAIVLTWLACTSFAWAQKRIVEWKKVTMSRKMTLPQSSNEVG